MRRFLGAVLATILLGCAFGCGGNSASSTLAAVNATATATKAFSGQYAFLVTGFDRVGNPLAIAGSITADGNGRITAGTVDVNDNFSVANSAVVGTYTADVNFRGVISFSNVAGNFLQPLGFAFSLKADGSSGVMIGFDNNLFIASGTFQKQDATAFGLSSLAGPYVFELDSHAPTQRSSVGSFTLNGSGTVTSSLEDTSIAGSAGSGVTATANHNFTGSYNATVATTGRGTATIVDNGATRTMAYYVISSSKFVAIETTAAGAITISSMVAVKQSATIPTSANMTGSVFAITGLDTAPAVNPGIQLSASAVGQLVVGGASGTITWDANDGTTIPGTPTTGPITASGSNVAVVYDNTTGRGTITVGNGGNSQGLVDSAVFYLSGAGAGFILDTTASATNRAMAGAFQPQSGPFSASSFSAAAIGVGTAGNTPNDFGSEDLILAPTAGSNILSGLEDSIFPFPGGPTQNSPFSFTFAVTSGATGRGTFTSSGNTYAFYLVAPNQYVFLNVTSGALPHYFSAIPQ